MSKEEEPHSRVQRFDTAEDSLADFIRMNALVDAEVEQARQVIGPNESLAWSRPEPIVAPDGSRTVLTMAVGERGVYCRVERQRVLEIAGTHYRRRTIERYVSTQAPLLQRATDPSIPLQLKSEAKVWVTSFDFPFDDVSTATCLEDGP